MESVLDPHCYFQKFIRLSYFILILSAALFFYFPKFELHLSDLSDMIKFYPFFIRGREKIQNNLLSDKNFLLRFLSRGTQKLSCLFQESFPVLCLRWLFRCLAVFIIAFLIPFVTNLYDLLKFREGCLLSVNKI